MLRLNGELMTELQWHLLLRREDRNSQLWGVYSDWLTDQGHCDIADTLRDFLAGDREPTKDYDFNKIHWFWSDWVSAVDSKNLNVISTELLCCLEGDFHRHAVGDDFKRIRCYRTRLRAIRAIILGAVILKKRAQCEYATK